MLLLSILMATTLANGHPYPPWSNGANNPATDRGFPFQVDDIDNLSDLHGNPADAKLVLFIGGNQFFVLPKLVAGFEALHPELKGHIFYETLPPGILRKQMSNNNTLTLGNFTLRVQPDVYEAGARVVDEMEESRQVEKSIHYAENNLEIMVHAGNSKGIRSLSDLGRTDVILSMPNPEWEGVARQISASLRKAGGEELYSKVYEQKVKDGTTYLTHIHHRQTPMRILQGKADAGVTWASEVRFQEKIANPIAGIKIPENQNTTAVYAAGVLRDAPHGILAREWVDYLRSAEAQAVYHEYGFSSVEQGNP